MIKKMTFLRFLRFGYPWMVVWGICVHLLWGVSLLLDDRVGKLTIFVGLQHLQDIGIPDYVTAIALIAVALLALWAVIEEDSFKPRVILAFLLPQYSLLVMAFLSDLEFIIAARNPSTGAYLSPVIMSAILGPVMIAAVLHTLSIVERFVLEPRRDA